MAANNLKATTQRRHNAKFNGRGRKQFEDHNTQRPRSVAMWVRLPDFMQTIIFDLDGTLADIEHRRHWLDKQKHPDLNSDARWRAFYAACVDDAPNTPVITMLRLLRHSYRIAIFSARSSEVRDQTQKWLSDNSIEYDFFRMRDSGDHTQDRELKAQWLSDYGKEKVFLVFDDRSSVVEMWRAQGLPCFQVAPGEF